RILVQKMRLLASRTGEQRPSDAELAAFYTAHRGEYRAPDRVSFWHVFVASPDAEARLASLRSSAAAPRDVVRHGDAFPVPAHVAGRSRWQAEKLFGADLAAAVAEAEIGTWIGPVRSPYGRHLVWIEAREGGSSPPLAAVRDRVLERWQDEQRALRVGALLHD